MRKLLFVTAFTAAFAIISGTSVLAHEAPTTTSGYEGNGTTSRFDIPANIFLPSEEKLKEVHYQMINNMMKDIIEAPKAKKRVRRGVWESGEEWHYNVESGREGECVVNTNIGWTHDMHFRTTYKIYSQHAEILSTSTAGTTSLWPGSYSSKETSILNNNERIVRSQAKFTAAISVVKNGIGELATRDYTMITTIHVRYAGDGLITYTVSSTVSG